MRGRFVIVGLTVSAVLAFGSGTAVVPTPAAAEFRVPGLFGGKKVVKRKRPRRAAPVQPVRNPDRTFAAVSAKASSPDIAKNSLAALSVGTASSATARLALKVPLSVADRADDSGGQDDEAKAPPKAVAEAAPSAENEKRDAEVAENDAVKTEDETSKPGDTASTAASDTGDAQAQDEQTVDSGAASDADDKAEATARAQTTNNSDDSTAAAEHTDKDQNEPVAADASTESEPDAIETATDDKNADKDFAGGTSAKGPEPTSADAKTQDSGKAASDSATDKVADDVADTSKAAAAVDEGSEIAAEATKPTTRGQAPADTKAAADAKEAVAEGQTKSDETAEPDRRAAASKDDADHQEGSEEEASKSASGKKVAENDEKPIAKPKASDATLESESVAAPLPPVPRQKPGRARVSEAASTPESLANADDVTEGDTTDALTGNAAAPNSRVHDAIVVLDISPPPSDKTEADETAVAALAPDLRPSLKGAPTDALTDDPTADQLAPSSDKETVGEDNDSAAKSKDSDAAAGQESSIEGGDNVSLDLGPPPPPPVAPVIAAVRAKLDSSAPNLAAPDLEALKAFYGERDDDPLWVSDDRLTHNAKTLITTIGDAEDWGLDADAYAVPAPGSTLATDEARADAELALSAALLKYARHAQTGRLTPSKAHKLFDFQPKARDPKLVLAQIAESKTPDKTLLALHPQHQQYQSLHAALIHARDSAKNLGRDPDNDRMVQLIVINMERWRWLPSDLGNFHVWNNIPEFNFRVVKGGREIYEAITIVGQTKYATAFFSAPMRNIVFNPNWTVPPTIVKEDIGPKLKGPQRSGGLFAGRESRNRMLARYGLKVSRGGKPVDADSVDWQTANVHAYTFQQDPGPHNVLGQFKFNFPNKHAIYMHDTTQKELFGRQVRTLSHGCIRVHQPARFAAVLLAEDKGWSMGAVQDVLARSQGQTKVIALQRKIPVHLTYNTLVADGFGTVREFGDVYGIDNQMAAKLFKNPAYFNVPFSGAEFAETTPNRRYSEPRRRRGGPTTVDDFLSGLLGN